MVDTNEPCGAAASSSVPLALAETTEPPSTAPATRAADNKDEIPICLFMTSSFLYLICASRNAHMLLVGCIHPLFKMSQARKRFFSHFLHGGMAAMRKTRHWRGTI